MSTHDHLAWRKSSKSDDQTNCVEVAPLPEQIAVRDTKDPSGPVLVFDQAAWSALIHGVRRGDFNK